MPSMDFDATGTPADIVASLSLTPGTRYAGQNVSTTATAFIREAATAPAVGARAHKVEAGGQFTLNPLAGEGIYAWTDDPLGCPLIVTEAA